MDRFIELVSKGQFTEAVREMGAAYVGYWKLRDLLLRQDGPGYGE